MVCTMRRDGMRNAPRSYAQCAEMVCTMRRDGMYNAPRWYVQCMAGVTGDVPCGIAVHEERGGDVLQAEFADKVAHAP